MAYIVLLILAGALGLVLILQFRWHWYPLQYLYFLRIPIMSALFLACLWTLGISLHPFSEPCVVPGSFYNLFVLEGSQIGLVAFVAVLSAWTVVHAGRWVYVRTPEAWVRSNGA